jgi:hypothetical protein
MGKHACDRQTHKFGNQNNALFDTLQLVWQTKNWGKKRPKETENREKERQTDWQTEKVKTKIVQTEQKESEGDSSNKTERVRQR